MDIARVDPEEVADTYPDVPILGYTNHTDTAGLRWQPEIGPIAQAIVSTVKPKAGDMEKCTQRAHSGRGS